MSTAEAISGKRGQILVDWQSVAASDHVARIYSWSHNNAMVATSPRIIRPLETLRKAGGPRGSDTECARAEVPRLSQITLRCTSKMWSDVVYGIDPTD